MTRRQRCEGTGPSGHCERVRGHHGPCKVGVYRWYAAHAERHDIDCGGCRLESELIVASRQKVSTPA